MNFCKSQHIGKVFFRRSRNLYFGGHQSNLWLDLFFRGCLPYQVHIGSDRAVVVVPNLPTVEDVAVKGDEENPAARDEQGGAGAELQKAYKLAQGPFSRKKLHK